MGDEIPVVAREADKVAQLGHGGRTSEEFNGGGLGLVDRETRAGDGVAEEADRGLAEAALVQTQSEADFSELGQEGLEFAQEVVKVGGRGDHIVHKRQSGHAGQLAYDDVHHSLEVARCSHRAHGHADKLKKTELADKGGLVDVLGAVGHLPEASSEVERGKVAVAMQLVENVLDLGHRVFVGNRDSVQAAVVDANADRAIRLGDGDDGCGPRGRARANDAGREKAANIVVDGSSFGRAETTGAVSDWVRLGGADAEWLDVGQAKRAFSTGLKGKASTARSRRVAQLEGSHEDDVSINDRGTRSGSSSGLAGAAKVNSTAAARATEATLANSLIGSRRSGDKSVRSEAWLMPVWSPAELINYVACK